MRTARRMTLVLAVLVLTLALTTTSILGGCGCDAAASTSSAPSTSPTPTTAPSFVDVPSDHRYAHAIRELARLGIVGGKGDGSFGPDEPVYRAQFAKMICGLLEIEVTEEQSFAPFTDLGPDDPDQLYPHEFVGAAYQAGITKGTSATNFSPYTKVSLPQVITMVVRAADAHHPGLLASPPADWYACWAHGESVHGANVRRADHHDLLALLPIQSRWADVARPATRGEVAQILFNLRERLSPPIVTLTFEGEALALTHPIQVETNRYYLPLVEFLESLGGTLTVSAEEVHQKTASIDLALDLSTGTYTVNHTTSRLVHRPRVFFDHPYLSLIDLQQMLNLKVVWDEQNEMVRLFWNRDRPTETKQNRTGKTALIRFEDITANQRYSTGDSLERLREVFDYCHAKDIPMHLGWIPRYIDPENGIDNSPAQDYSIHNAHFVYTLDYFEMSGGLIGLHGYTHQYGEEVSIWGTEFNAKRNTSETSIRTRLQYALNDANKLGIDVAFFESPHYSATWNQKMVIGRVFDILYEGKQSWEEPNISKVDVGGKTITFIPTPFGYIDDPAADTANMIARIKAPNAGRLGSFFYHPYIEARFMTLEIDEDGYPSYQYAADFPLHRVIDAFMEAGYTFKSIRAL